MSEIQKETITFEPEAPSHETIRRPGPETEPPPDAAKEICDTLMLAVKQAGASAAATQAPSSPGAEFRPQTSPGGQTGLAVRLIRVIGKGGQGEVWEALQMSLNRVIAIKRASTGEAMKRVDFLKEAFTAGALDHPNIVPVYDLGVDDSGGESVPYLAMKRIEGRTWSKVMRADRQAQNFSLADFLARHIPILIDVINAVAFAHSRGIIHRDLKPQQVMIGEFGEVFLLDWGLALYLEEERRRGPAQEDLEPVALTENHRFFTKATATNPAGSPAYMAPEQAMTGTHALGYHTDIYLIGAMLYQMIAGHPPHDAPKVRDALEQAARNEITQLPKETPPELNALVMRCLHTMPDQRPQSVLEVRDALESFLTGAGKRTESQEIARKLQETREGLTDYGALSEAMRRLAEAGQLWPQNPDLPALREQLLQRFVEVAMGRRDFILAELQADRLRSPALSEEMRARVDAAREAADREIPQPPLWTRGRVALLLVVWAAFGALLFLVLQTAEAAVLEEVDARVRSMATLAAEEMRPQNLRAVAEDRKIYRPEYQSSFNQLNALRRAGTDLQHLFVLQPEPLLGENQWRVLISTSPEDLDADMDGTISPVEAGMPPGQLFADPSAQLNEALQNREAQAALLESERGAYYSGFAPIIAPGTGTVMAIAVAEVSYESINARIGRLKSAAIAAFLVLAALMTLALIAFFQSRRSLQRVHQLQERIQKQNAELRKDDLFLG